MIEASAAPDVAFWIDAIGRLVVATAAGMVLGWERSRENRQIMGLRTLGLVGLASCIAVQAIVHSGLPNVNADAAGRGDCTKVHSAYGRSERAVNGGVQSPAVVS